jgi:hypothetical protein
MQNFLSDYIFGCLLCLIENESAYQYYNIRHSFEKPLSMDIFERRLIPSLIKSNLQANEDRANKNRH